MHPVLQASKKTIAWILVSFCESGGYQRLDFKRQVPMNSCVRCKFRKYLETAMENKPMWLKQAFALRTRVFPK